MQAKIYNAYRITHKNGVVEDINALDLIQALENMEVPDTESRVLQAFLAKENVRTLIEEEKKEIMFTAIVAENGGGSIATPASGKIHVGDMIQLKAIPARGYEFVSWLLNGTKISEDASVNFTMPEMANTAVFMATFKLADIAWKSEVSPSDSGCIAFPLSGTAPANSELSLIAVEANGFTFDHWERNGVSIGSNKILTTKVTPLAENELECKYIAVFNRN